MKKYKVAEIGLERIYRLFELAEKWFAKNPERSKRCISLAIEIGKKARVRMPDVMKSRYCKKCNAFLKKGKNAEFREAGKKEPGLGKGVMIVKCLECGFERKIGKKSGKTGKK